MKTFLRKLAALALALAALTLAAPAAAEGSELAARAFEVYDQLAAGEYAQVAARFGEEMAALLDEASLEAAMEGVAAQLGAMTGASLAQANEEARAAALLVEHERGRTLMQVAFDGDWKIAGLYIQIADAAAAQPLERELPEGARAEEVTLFPGTARELAGEIIVPAGADGETAYVVFAQGSGPSDKDETVGANKPLRDIAYDLAALGVGSLRYDKITYAAPDWPVETVEQEYMEPAKEALRVLREATGARRAYLVGHSLGGMLAPYLVEACGFDGGVALAGTPLQLWEISRAQNIALTAYMDEAQRKEAETQIAAQTALAQGLAGMSDEEAAGATVFGMSAVYLRHMARMDQAEIARESGKPFLFLWGDEDAQVDGEAFGAWAERLSDGPFTYAVYEGLNHLFIPAGEGENIANLAEAYAKPSRVDERVARDIAGWIAGL